MADHPELELSSTFRVALLPEYNRTIVICDIVTQDEKGRLVEVEKVHQSVPLATKAEAEEVAVASAEQHGFLPNQMLWTDPERV